MMEVRLSGSRRTHAFRTTGRVWSRAALLCAVLVLTPLPTKSLHAQKRGSRVRVLTGSALRTAPGGNVLGTLSRSFDAEVEMEQGTSVRVRLSGFVVASDLDVEARQSRATVGGDGTEIRTGSSVKDPVLATLRRGTVVFPAQKGRWVLRGRQAGLDRQEPPGKVLNGSPTGARS